MLVLGTSHYNGVGSNPTAAKTFFFFVFFLASTSSINCFQFLRLYFSIRTKETFLVKDIETHGSAISS